MPEPTEILRAASEAANRMTSVAIAWHLLIVAALIALYAGARPPQRLARAALSAPLASVSACAFATGNPFNGGVFGVAALVVLVLGICAATRSTAPRRWTTAAGLLAIGFGLVYPHFLADGGWRYLYAAPVGVVPCPTLAIVTGFALLGAGLGSRAWSATIAALALLYGVFGVLRLGVVLDVPLIAAGFALASLVVASGARGRPSRDRGRRGAAARAPVACPSR